MKTYVVKTSLMTLPHLIGGLDVMSNKKFKRLRDARKYASKFKKFLANKKIENGVVEYTDEEREFFGGHHVALSFNGIESVDTITIE